MIINIPSDIGSIIRDARKRKGWTQKDLALKVGIQQRTISVIENDPSTSALKNIIKITKVLGLIVTVSAPVSTQEGEVDW